MVVSDRLLASPVRPQWTRGGSWRSYIKTHSNRKLHVDLPSLTPERHVKFNVEQNQVEELAEEDAAVKEQRWFNVRTKTTLF